MAAREGAPRRKIVLPGGSGQVGSVLARAFHAGGDEVVVLSRQPAPAASPWRTVAWDAATLGVWARELDGADVVVNLAGRNVNCRYTAANRAAILDSRVRSTRAVGAAIAAARPRPRVWLQASTATIYAHRFDAPNDERSGQIGGTNPTRPPRGASASRWRVPGRRSSPRPTSPRRARWRCAPRW
jgi:NAD dependent epimerase/dehydratase family enzyme